MHTKCNEGDQEDKLESHFSHIVNLYFFFSLVYKLLRL